MMLGLEI